MRRYAEKTEVPISRSKTEIEAILEKYGATEFGYMSKSGKATIGFRLEDRLVRITLPLPYPDDDEFMWTPTGKERTENSRKQAYEQAVRSRWRALALVTKAKLEACAVKISTVEREFFYDIVTPDGETVGEKLRGQIEAMYRDGQPLRLLEA